MGNGWGGTRPGAGRKPKETLPAVAGGWLSRLSGKISEVAWLVGRRQRHQQVNPFRLPHFPPGAVPAGFEGKGGMAADEKITRTIGWAQDEATSFFPNEFAGMAVQSALAEGQTWLGYPLLSLMAQRAEYRVITETIAEEMTRKWIKFKSKADEGPTPEDEKKDDDGDEPEEAEDAADPLGEEIESEVPPGGELPDMEDEEDDDEPSPEEKARKERKERCAERIKELTEEFERLKIADAFRQAATHDGFFGRGHIYLEIAEDGKTTYDDPDELTTDIGTGWNDVSKQKVTKTRKLQRVWNVEPVWAYPTFYNSSDPLAPDWYRPTQWHVMGRPVHSSRLLRFVGREVGDLLKPAYAFGGLSMSQMAKPYVDNWLRTRQSVSDLIHSFSVSGIKTDLGTAMMGDGDQLFRRAGLFADMRDNHNLLILQNGPEGQGEEFFNVSTPLGSLDKLQAQSQEQMASVARIPLVKLLGIQPAGLSASSEGEIRTFYDHIAAYQRLLFWDNLNAVLGFVMLSLWGEVDPDITVDFEPLLEQTEKEKAESRKADAEVDKIYIDSGVLHPEEARRRIADDPDTPYQDIDVEDVPDLKEEEQQGLVPGGKGPGGEPGGGGGGPGGGRPTGGPGGPGGAGQEGFPKLAYSRDQRRIGTDARDAPEHRVTVEYDGDFDMVGLLAHMKRLGGIGASRDIVAIDEDDKPVRFNWDGDGADKIWRIIIDGRKAVDARPFAGDAFEWLESDHPRDEGGKFSSGGGAYGGFQAPQFGLSSPAKQTEPPKPRPPLDPSKLKQVGGQLGSNPGGQYEDAGGERYYVKKGKSPEHVRNELTAAALYKLVGTPLLKYRPVEGGAHVATRMEKLDKDNANKLNEKEVAEARKDFAAHAWLGNWDAAGLGGDNIGTVKGTPTALDLGGALEYRAQGAPKGKAFGTSVGEWDTLRDPKANKDTAKLFAGMTPAELRESARYVTRIKDGAIRKAVEENGGAAALADKLIARRDDLAERMKTAGAEGDPDSPEGVAVFAAGEKPKATSLNGQKFKPWEPPEDWSTVEGQAELDEPPIEVGKGKQAASGLLIMEPDGRVWMVRPKNAFGGYEHTFPKGRVDEGLSPQANAIKEAWEESGIKADVQAMVGDLEGDVTTTRYYLATRSGGEPVGGEETDGVVLAPPGKLKGFLNRSRDRQLARVLGADQALDEFHEADHPRDEGGKFTEGAGVGAAVAKIKGGKKTKLNAGGEENVAEFVENHKEEGYSWEHVSKTLKPYEYSEKVAEAVFKSYGANELAQYIEMTGKTPEAVLGKPLSGPEFQDAFESATPEEAAKLAKEHPDLAEGYFGIQEELEADLPLHLQMIKNEMEGAPSPEHLKEMEAEGLVEKPEVPPTSEWDDGVKAQALGEPLVHQHGVKAFEKVYDSMMAALENGKTFEQWQSVHTGVAEGDVDLQKQMWLEAFEKVKVGSAEPNPYEPPASWFEDFDAWKAYKDAPPDEKAAVNEKWLAEKSGKSGGADPDVPKTYVGLGYASGGTPIENFSKTYEKIVNGKTLANADYRRLVAFAIKRGKDLKLGGSTAGLQAKLAESWALTGEKLTKKGDLENAYKAQQKAKQLGWDPAGLPLAQAAKGKTLEEWKQQTAKFEKAEQNMGKAGVPAEIVASMKAAQYAGKTFQQWQAEQGAAKKFAADPKAKAAPPVKPTGQDPAVKKAVEAPAPKFPPPTEAELAKAKKNVALQLQFVPGANFETAQGKAEAQNLVDHFNDKYATIQITEKELPQKVHDFKAMQAKMAALQKVEQSKKAEWQSQAQKAQAEANAKAAAQAKAAVDAAKQKNAAVMKDLGITEAEATGFHALVGMMGGNSADVVGKFKSYAAKAASYGYPISGFQAALIAHYTNGGYGSVNSALRSESWSEAQHVYARLISKAIQAMPTFKGITKRGTGLTKEQQAAYVAGHVKREEGITSTSPTKPWGGNTQFVITAIGKRAAHVKKLSSHGHEDEVLYAPHTLFRITKVDGKPGENMTVHMEEMEHDI